jgi:hypothetical protein
VVLTTAVNHAENFAVDSPELPGCGSDYMEMLHEVPGDLGSASASGGDSPASPNAAMGAADDSSETASNVWRDSWFMLTFR